MTTIVTLDEGRWHGLVTDWQRADRPRTSCHSARRPMIGDDGKPDERPAHAAKLGAATAAHGARRAPRARRRRRGRPAPPRTQIGVATAHWHCYYVILRRPPVLGRRAIYRYYMISSGRIRLDRAAAAPPRRPVTSVVALRAAGTCVLCYAGVGLSHPQQRGQRREGSARLAPCAQKTRSPRRSHAVHDRLFSRRRRRPPPPPALPHPHRAQTRRAGLCTAGAPACSGP